MKQRGSQDLRLQLLALYLLFVLSIFVLAFALYVSASERLREDVAVTDLTLARSIALETDAMLLKAKEAVAAFAEMSAVIEADEQGMERLFAAGTAARQDIELFYRLSAEGLMLYHYPSEPSLIGQDFSLGEAFQKVRTTREHLFSNGHLSATTKRPVIGSLIPVFRDEANDTRTEQGRGERFDGMVGINIELEQLSDIVRRIGLKLPQSQEVKIIIVDGMGQVIAHSEPDQLLNQMSERLPGISEVLSGREGSLTANDAWHVEWIYSFTPIPSAGWGVITQRPTRLAFASLESFQRGFVLALVLVGIGFFIFWKILSIWLIIPLEKLTDYGESVGQETVEAALNHEVILPLSIRPNQIGRLTRALLRAERNIRRRLLELTSLNKTSAAVASTLDTEQVINTILDAMQRLLQVSKCALLVMNEKTQELEIRASRGLSERYVEALDLTDPARTLPANRAIALGKPIQVPDVELDEGLAPLMPLIRKERYRSLLVIPLSSLHIPPAVLTIYRSQVCQFSEQEIDLVTSFANHAAIALEQALLFSLTDAELQKRVRFLSALNQVARTVSQSLLMDEIHHNAMQAILEVMPADACWIYLQRETETFLRLRAQQGLPDRLAQQLREQSVEVGIGLIGEVVQRGESLFLNDFDLQKAELQDEPLIGGQDWDSLVMVPLTVKEAYQEDKSLIGLLGMATQTEDSFSQAEVDLLQAIGDQLAIAVVNARLYRRSREAAILEERNRMAREIHDTLAQSFMGILLQLQAAERLSVKRPEKASQSLQEAQELAREGLQEARRSVLNLRPTILENLTLDRAIAQHLQRFEKQSALQTDFILEGYPSPLQPIVEQNLYRITQEALTNVKRHAQAQSVMIHLAFDAESVTLTISDDGVGLNGQSHQANDKTKGGFGLLGIQERVNLMSGNVTFETIKPSGTQIKVVIPK